MDLLNFIQRVFNSLAGHRNITYVRHARQRMKWRKVSEDEVIQTLKQPDKTVSLGGHKYHAYKIMNSRNIRATYRKYEQGVIVLTVFDKSD